MTENRAHNASEDTHDIASTFATKNNLTALVTPLLWPKADIHLDVRNRTLILHSFLAKLSKGTESLTKGRTWLSRPTPPGFASLGLTVPQSLLSRADEVIEWRFFLLRCMSPLFGPKRTFQHRHPMLLSGRGPCVAILRCRDGPRSF